MMSRRAAALLAYLVLAAAPLLAQVPRSTVVTSLAARIDTR